VWYWARDYPEHAIELFTRLDKIMAEFCSEPEGVEGLNEGSVKRWRALRMSFIEQTRYQRALRQFHLSDGY